MRPERGDRRAQSPNPEVLGPGRFGKRCYTRGTIHVKSGTNHLTTSLSLFAAISAGTTSRSIHRESWCSSSGTDDSYLSGR